MRLCPWSLALASSNPVLGLERFCPRKGCPWPWPRIFFVSLALALASSLVSSTPPLLKTLLNWAASSTTLQFQGKYYKQVDGIAMGSPIDPILADVFMNYVIEEALSASQQNRPTLLLRYVDDLFLVFSNDEEAQSFFDVMNRIHKSINFTQEQESNGQLAFLDVLVSRNTGNVAQTSVFRKKTHTGLYLKWTSFVPYRYKRNLVNSLLQRAYKIRSSYKLIHSDFMRIKEMLAKNGYPRTFVDNCIRDFFKFQTHGYEENKPNYYSTYSKAFDLQASLSGTNFNASTA